MNKVIHKLFIVIFLVKKRVAGVENLGLLTCKIMSDIQQNPPTAAIDMAIVIPVSILCVSGLFSLDITAGGFVSAIFGGVTIFTLSN